MANDLDFCLEQAQTPAIVNVAKLTSYSQC